MVIEKLTSYALDTKNETIINFLIKNKLVKIQLDCGIVTIETRESLTKAFSILDHYYTIHQLYVMGLM